MRRYVAVQIIHTYYIYCNAICIVCIVYSIESMTSHIERVYTFFHIMFSCYCIMILQFLFIYFFSVELRESWKYPLQSKAMKHLHIIIFNNCLFTVFKILYKFIYYRLISFKIYNLLTTLILIVCHYQFWNHNKSILFYIYINLFHLYN